MKISRLAIGNPTMAPSLATYRAPAGLTQDRHIDGLPLGTRGGMIDSAYFPLDAEYEFGVTGSVFTMDGQPVEVNNLRNFRLPVKAGPHTLGLAIVDRQRPAGVDDLWSVPYCRRRASFDHQHGPWTRTDPVIRQAAAVSSFAAPRSVSETDELSCARRVVQTLSRRAFRRPVLDSEVDKLDISIGRDAEMVTFENGVERALAGTSSHPPSFFGSKRSLPMFRMAASTAPATWR